MDSFGNNLRKLRESKLLTLKKLADALGMDVGQLCHIEKGNRSATREQVIKLATFFGVNQQNLITEWLSEKLAGECEDEPTALKALQLAEEKVKYHHKKN